MYGPEDQLSKAVQHSKNARIRKSNNSVSNEPQSWREQCAHLRNQRCRSLCSLVWLQVGWLLPERYVEPARLLWKSIRQQMGDRRTRATNDSLMREVTMVLFPTPSAFSKKNQHQTGKSELSFRQDSWAWIIEFYSPSPTRRMRTSLRISWLYTFYIRFECCKSEDGVNKVEVPRPYTELRGEIVECHVNESVSWRVQIILCTQRWTN